MHKYGLKVLGLTVMAALGLMVFTAVATAAVELKLGDEFYSGEAGVFLTNSGTTTPTGLTTQAVAGKQIGSGRLLIPGKSSEIVCAEGEITSGSVANEYENFKTATMGSGGHGSGSIEFKSCKVQEINPTTGELTGKELAKCTEELNKPTHVVTANVLLLVKKHEGKTYLIAVPKVGSKAVAEENEKLTSPFTTLKFGGTCSLPETVKVTGSVATAAPSTDAVKPKLNINTFSAAGKEEQKLIGTVLKFGASEAFIQAEAEAELVGKSVVWGAM